MCYEAVISRLITLITEWIFREIFARCTDLYPNGYKICAPYELTVIRTWYGRVHGREWCEAWWWNQSVSWFVRPVKSTPTAHGLDSTRSFLILFYAHLLYSLLRASSIFSSTRIFLILTLSKESHWTGSDRPQMKCESSKLQTIHPVLWEKRRSNSVWYNCHTAHGVSTD